MLTRTHLAAAILLYLVILNFIPEKIIFLIFLVIGTIFVDIDTKKSKAGKTIFLRPLQWFTRHRGIFHTILFAIFISLIIAFYHKWAAIGFFAGYILHLLLDMLTKSGVRLLYPFSSQKFSSGIRSGGLVEEIIFVLLLLADVIFVGIVFYKLYF